MNFENVYAEIKSDEPKEIAKVVFDFFVWQSENAMRNEISARCDYQAAIAANEAAKQEYERENELGWGPKFPYDTYALKVKEMAAEKASLNRADAKKLLNFVRDRLLDKLV